MNRQADLAVKAETAGFNDTLFLVMELSRATWLVATFAPRLGDKISVHAIPGGDTKRLLDLIGRLQAKLRGKGARPTVSAADLAIYCRCRRPHLALQAFRNRRCGCVRRWPHRPGDPQRRNKNAPRDLCGRSC